MLTDLIHKTVLDIQARVPKSIEKILMQEPVTFEDALGRISYIQVGFLDSWEVGIDPKLARIS